MKSKKFVEIMIRLVVVVVLLLSTMVLVGGEVRAQETTGALTPIAYAAGDADLLIITPLEFSAALTPLVEHKNTTGMPTRMITLEDIYATFVGDDEPEKIKYAIRHYYDTENISYVMLVGDCNKFPIRWQLGHFNDHLISDDDPANDDKLYCAADFYYADIYDEYGTFKTWDYNVNGLYGELYRDDITADNIDPIPDVAVARVPSANVTQVETYVDKVITYELTAFDTDWFKRLLLIQKEWTEDVHAKEAIAGHLFPLGFETTRLYEDIDPADYSGPIDGLPNSYCISRELNRGVGFVSELYHGYPQSWDYLYNTDDIANDLYNCPRYPVIYSGACETAKFYGKAIPYRRYLAEDGFQYGPVPIGSVGDTVYPAPDPIQPYDNVLAIGEAFLVATDDGAIAYYGCLETGEVGMHKILDESFFEAYSLGHNILGDMWKYAMEEFASVYNLRNLTPDGTWVPVCKMHTPSRFLLLGDPSLRVGGISLLLQPLGCEWSQIFLDNSAAYSIAATDGGYVVAGSQWPSEAGPGLDIWAAMAELDLFGNIVDWATFETESKHNAAYSVIPRYTEDELDGYAVTGFKYKHYTENSHEYDQPDVWLMTTNTSLDKQWDERYGQPCTDRGNSIVRDGSGYVIGGWRDLCGSGNGYLVRTHENGDLDWEVMYALNEIHSVENAQDSGYILGTDSGIVKVDSGSPPSHVWTTGDDCYYSVKQTADGGYVGVGETPSPSDAPDVILTKLNSSGNISWTKTFGRMEPVLGATGYGDAGRDVAQTFDGGYIVVGYTESYGWYGGKDVWVIKTDSSGEIEWDMALGGGGNEIGYSVVEAPDGGYVVAGSASFEDSTRMWIFKVTGGFQPPVPSFTYSPQRPVFLSETVDFDASMSADPDGTIIGYEWDFGDGITSGGIQTQHDYSAPGDYTVTLYVTDNDGVVRCTSQSVMVTNMAVQWEKRLGGDKGDAGFSIIEAVDGGYIIAGYTNSYAHVGPATDAWLLKIDEHGDIVWETVLTDWDNRPELTQSADCVARTRDDGYIITGKTEINDVNSGSTDRTDLWLIKTDKDGNPAWYKNLGGDASQVGNCVAPTSDGGYIIVGQTASEEGRGVLWLIKTASNGIVEWDEYIEHPDYPYFQGHWVSPTRDGGYITTGRYASASRTVPLIYTDNVGIEDWRVEWTGSMAYAWGAWVGEALDGGYVVAGGYDGHVGLMKTDFDGDEVWSRTLGTGYWENGFAAAQTPDGGYIVTGITKPTQPIKDNIYVVKADSQGKIEWDMSFGTDMLYEEGHGVLPLADGSYIILGWTQESGGDIWLIKLGANHTPVADFTYYPASPVVGEIITFDASASDDPDGTIVSYDWDFGNGDSVNGTIVDYAFPLAGNFNVSLTAKDNKGGEHTVSRPLAVIAGVTPDFEASPLSGEFPILVHFTDLTSGGETPYSYAWDMDNNGSIDSTTQHPDWYYTDHGSYTVRLDVEDADGHVVSRIKEDYIIVYGVSAVTSDVTVDDWEITDDPASDPETYDPSEIPPDVNLDDARGFCLSASGPNGSYHFRITFSAPIGNDFTLYKLPEWVEVLYTRIDDYTIDVELDIDDGVLDPPFVIAYRPPLLPGDANGDSVINIFDMTKVARIILELDDPTPGADSNGDGVINIFDMTKIARIILRLD